MTDMTNDSEYQQLRELSWQRKLTGEEEARLRQWLAAHPEAEMDWELEASLNSALDALPAASVASNFTARVLQAVERDEAATARRNRGVSFWGRFRWLPRIAVAAVVLGAGMISYQQVQANRNRERFRAVEVVSNVTSLPAPDVLKDFDAIQALNQAPPADEELLAALK